MVIIDSSVYCARFLVDDSSHMKSKKIFDEIDEKILLPYIVFTETLTVLTYKHSKERANEFAEFIASDNRFVLTQSDMMSEVSFWNSIDKKMSYIDIVICFLALQNSAELISLDDQMNNLYKSLL
jgi:predicted nucleic acid-binding protein